jgi:hypothetical protein
MLMFLTDWRQDKESENIVNRLSLEGFEYLIVVSSESMYYLLIYITWSL